MKSRNYISLGVLIVLAYLLLRIANLYPRWQNTGGEATVSWDVFGYYLYLPAAFIHDDLATLSFREEVMQKYQPAGDFHHSTVQDDGRHVLKYPIGMAVLYLPFFLIAHFLAGIMDYAADGFSWPYQFMLSMGSLIYAVLGLGLLRRFLLKYFADLIVAVVLVILVLGTNYLNYTAFDGAMPHNALFTLYALLLLLTERYFSAEDSGQVKPKPLRALVIGLVIGLMTIIRPIELISILIPLLWGVYNKESFLAKWQLIREHWTHIGLIVLGMFVMGMIQMGYWKAFSGSWLYYSYGDFGFDWRSPHLWEGLASYRKGWLIYTPVMILALIGFVPLYRRLRERFFMVVALFLITFYIVFAWEVWWYGGSFGARPLVQSYALLSLPIAALLSAAWEHKSKVWAIVLGVFIFLCVDLNLMMTWQAHSRNSGWEAEYMTHAYFWKIVANPRPKKEDKKFLDVREELDADDLEDMNRIPLYQNNFDQDTTGSLATRKAASPPHAWLLNAESQFSPAFESRVGDLPAYEDCYLRVEAQVYFEQMEWNIWNQAQFTTLFIREGDTQPYRQTNCRIQRLYDPWAWHELHYEMRIPSRAQPTDIVKVYFWNAGSQKEVFIDDMQIELLQPKD
ncbi:MAG: hypothetical protein AB8H47_15230 [Bacteroidia bacterium]